MNYLLKVKNFTVDCMIANEYEAAEIRDEYYKLLIKVGKGTTTQKEFRNYHETIQNILSKNSNVEVKN